VEQSGTADRAKQAARHSQPRFSRLPDDGVMGRNSRAWDVVGATIGFVVACAVAGVLVAVLLTPGIAVASVATDESTRVLQSLPDYIHLGQLPQRNRIFANGSSGPRLIATVYDQNREDDSWAEVSPYLKAAAVDGEDKGYYSHGGVDVGSLVRAALSNLRAGSVQSGASTIPMQVVRNVEVQNALQLPTVQQQRAAYQAATSETIARKLTEIKLAIELEKRYTKQQVLLAYLNIANFGEANYGVEAAAEAYFSTTAAAVTPAQAASIVAIVQDPSSRNLSDPKNFAANEVRRNFILGQMLAAKDLTRAQYQTAVDTPVNAAYVHPSVPQNGCLDSAVPFQWMCDYIVGDVRNLPELGSTPTMRAANWKLGGYDVYTTLDSDAQTTATTTLQRLVPNTEQRFQLGGAVATVQPGTGRILIMAENKTLNNTLAGGGPATTAVNFTTDEANGGSIGFQPGSAYKLFTLIDWLQNGHTLSASINASVRSLPAARFTDSCEGGRLRGSPYTFANDENEQGPTTILRATARSINSVFIQMAAQLDLCDIRKVAESLGVHNATGAPLSDDPSCVIGGCSNTIAPLTLAAAYAAVADNGVYCSPIAVDRMVGPGGQRLPGENAQCHQAIAPTVADTAAYALEGVMVGGGTAAAANPRDGTPFLGKTGTTDNSLQTWIVASSTRAATAVWVGNISGSQQLRDIDVNGMQAAVLRHPVFKAIMTYVDSQLGTGAAFPPPDPSLVSGRPVGANAAVGAAGGGQAGAGAAGAGAARTPSSGQSSGQASSTGQHGSSHHGRKR
jgi:membrane peptidoglycan carboxypeptidase